MRILHVSEVGWGGVISLLRLFVSEQARRGDCVALLAPPITPPIEGIASSPWSLQRRSLHTYPVAVRELRDTVKRFRPDVIHLHSFLAGFLGRLPGAVATTPTVYQPHAWSFDLVADENYRRAVQLWERLASGRTRVMVTNCQAEIDEGRLAGVSTVSRVVGVAVDTERFAPVTDLVKRRYRRELGVSDPRLLLCIGRLARQKGQDLLVSAWERRRPDGTELVLVGPGETDALRELAPTQWGRSIRAVGECRDVRPWLWACDALLLPSRYETVAVVVAEAMAVGRPVVATDVNGAREVIEGGDLPSAGRVVPLGDMTALLARSQEVLDDPQLVGQMAGAGRSRAQALFSAHAVAERLDEAYRERLRLPLFSQTIPISASCFTPKPCGLKRDGAAVSTPQRLRDSPLRALILCLSKLGG